MHRTAKFASILVGFTCCQCNFLYLKVTNSLKWQPKLYSTNTSTNNNRHYNCICSKKQQQQQQCKLERFYFLHSKCYNKRVCLTGNYVISFYWCNGGDGVCLVYVIAFCAVFRRIGSVWLEAMDWAEIYTHVTHTHMV